MSTTLDRTTKLTLDRTTQITLDRTTQITLDTKAKPAPPPEIDIDAWLWGGEQDPWGADIGVDWVHEG